MKHLIFGALISFTFCCSAQLSSGVQAYYQFSNNSGENSSNAIVTSNVGAVYGTDRFLAPNEALNTQGAGYFAFNDDAVKVDLPLTISVWVNIEDLSVQNHIFVSDNVYGNYFGYWLTASANTGQLGISFGAGLGTSNVYNRRSFVTNVGLTENTWHHIVAIIRDYNDMDVYLDCVQASGSYSGSGSTTIAYSSSDSYIGAAHVNSLNPNIEVMSGRVDELAIWDREISGSEISQLCQSSFVLNTEDVEHETLQYAVLCYPNPSVDGRITIKEISDLNADFSVYNQTGSLIYESNIKKNQSAAIKLDSGVYFIRFVAENGQIITKKVVVG